MTKRLINEPLFPVIPTPFGEAQALLIPPVTLSNLARFTNFVASDIADMRARYLDGATPHQHRAFDTVTARFEAAKDAITFDPNYAALPLLVAHCDYGAFLAGALCFRARQSNDDARHCWFFLRENLYKKLSANPPKISGAGQGASDR